jgi:nucleotide sugar dehydrogenase
MKIGLIGAGRLGICLALLIEKAGYNVLASDSREDYIKDLQKGIINTAEPEVQNYLSEANNIEFTTDNIRVISECDLIFTLVATPSLADGSYDVSAVWKVINDFKNIPILLEEKSLIVGCTTNPGDCNDFQEALKDTGIDIFYNPEFIAQGSIIRDLQNADMVLIGGDGNHKTELEQMYEKIQMGFISPSIYFMSTKAAEVTKIAVNCFLTTKISYANMLGEVLTLSGMEDEIDNVLMSIGADDRIGKKYMRYGFGFGGPCFPRDNRAFASYASKVGVSHNIGEVTDSFNEDHASFLKKYFINKNKKKLPFLFEYLTYKPNTDILTESQQYRLCLDLLDEGYSVYCSDSSLKDQCDSRIIYEQPNEEIFVIKL